MIAPKTEQDGQLPNGAPNHEPQIIPAMEIFQNPTVIAALGGLVVGLLVALWTYLSGRSHRIGLQHEIEKLKGHLQQHLEIHAKGLDSRSKEYADLVRKVTNLEVSLVALSAKPSKSELRSLYVHEKGIQLMNIKVPGFAAHWETFRTEAELELQRILAGEGIWPRNLVRRTLGFFGFGGGLAEVPRISLETGNDENRH